MQIFSMYLISCYYTYTILKNFTVFIFGHLRLAPIHTVCCTFSRVSVVFPAELYDCPITAIRTRFQRRFMNQHESFFIVLSCHYCLHSVNIIPLASLAIVIFDTTWVLMSKDFTICMYVCNNCGLKNIDDKQSCKHCSFTIDETRI